MRNYSGLAPPHDRMRLDQQTGSRGVSGSRAKSARSGAHSDAIRTKQAAGSLGDEPEAWTLDNPTCQTI